MKKKTHKLSARCLAALPMVSARGTGETRRRGDRDSAQCGTVYWITVRIRDLSWVDVTCVCVSMKS